MRVGLTGGIASGKSTVARAVRRSSACPSSTPTRSRATSSRPARPLLAQVLARFGPGVRAADGSARPARAARARVSRRRSARRELEALLHPAIRRRAARAARPRPAGPTRSSSSRCWPNRTPPGDYDRVLVVDCDEALQRARLRSATAPAPSQVAGDRSPPRRRARARLAARRRRDRQRRGPGCAGPAGARHCTRATCELAAEPAEQPDGRWRGLRRGRRDAQAQYADDRAPSGTRPPPGDAARVRAAAERAHAHLPAPRFPLQPGAVPQREGQPAGAAARRCRACSTSSPSPPRGDVRSDVLKELERHLAHAERIPEPPGDRRRRACARCIAQPRPPARRPVGRGRRPGCSRCATRNSSRRSSTAARSRAAPANSTCRTISSG